MSATMTLTAPIKIIPGRPLPTTLVQIILHNALYVYNQGAKYGLPAAGSAIGAIWKARIQELYSEAGTYRRYWHSRLKGGSYTWSSQPGTPPALQTGDLRKSVTFYIAKLPARGPGGRFMAGFGTTAIHVHTDSTVADYAAKQEFGADGHAARPAWQIANLSPEGRRWIKDLTWTEFVKAEIIAAGRAKAGVPVTILMVTKGREAFRGKA